MQKAQDQRYDVLQSSSELGWSNLFAEVRSYGRGGGTHPAEPETKITILLDGSEGTSVCRIGGSWRLSEHIPGHVWSNQWAASMMRATPLLPKRFES